MSRLKRQLADAQGDRDRVEEATRGELTRR
jgi:hypothetical protein